MPFVGTYEERADDRGRVEIPAPWREYARQQASFLYVLGAFDPPRVTTDRVFRGLVDRMRNNVDEAESEEEYESRQHDFEWFLHNAQPVPADTRWLRLDLEPGTRMQLEGRSSYFTVARPAPHGVAVVLGYDARNAASGSPRGEMARYIFERDQGQRATHEAFSLVMGVHYGMFQRPVDGGTVMEVLTDYVVRNGDVFDASRLAAYAYRWFEQGGDASPASAADRMPWEGTPTSRADTGYYPEDDLAGGQVVDPFAQLNGAPVGRRNPRRPTRRRPSRPHPVEGSALEDLREARRHSFGVGDPGRRPAPHRGMPDPTVGRGMDPFGAPQGADDYYDDDYDDLYSQ